jgi:hypothetical protein
MLSGLVFQLRRRGDFYFSRTAGMAEIDVLYLLCQVIPD